MSNSRSSGKPAAASSPARVTSGNRANSARASVRGPEPPAPYGDVPGVPGPVMTRLTHAAADQHLSTKPVAYFYRWFACCT